MHASWLAAGILWCGIADAAPHDDMPPLELIATNLAEMPYTAHVRTTSVQVESDTHNRGYVTFHVQARVIETFNGAVRREIDYRQTNETPANGPRVGADLLVSLQQRPDGALYVADNGYVFPATPDVLKRARRAAKHAPRAG